MPPDELFMARCVALARLGAGSVAPNPMVGAVLVFENTVIGEGYHQVYGQAHAEVHCIRDAARQFAVHPLPGLSFEQVLLRSTLYVSLEPCAHFGKTPPCANLIIEQKIPAVVVGCRDPFPLVDGKGIEKLRAAGVQVTVGVLEAECIRLNQRFFTYHSHQRPFVILKWAQSFNGKMAAAGPGRTLISNALSNRLVHRWRSGEQAILVGFRTVLLDNPSLNTRLWKGKNPLRLVVDKHLQLPVSLKLFNDGLRTIIFNYRQSEEQGAVRYYQLPGTGSLVKEMLAAMHKLNVQSVLVEGGAGLLKSFLEEGYWDEARVITNTSLDIHEGLDAPSLPEAVLVERQAWEEDEIRFYRPVHKRAEKLAY